MRRTHRYQNPLPRYRSDARLQRQRSPSRYIDELTMSGVLEPEPVANLNLEPRLQFLDSLCPGVLDRHPADLHTASPPLSVAHVVVSTAVLLGMVRSVYLDQHGTPIPHQEEVRHPNVSRPDPRTWQRRDGERPFHDRRRLQSDQCFVDSQLLGVGEREPVSHGRVREQSLPARRNSHVISAEMIEKSNA